MHTEETRRKIALARTGQSHSEETRAKISAGNRGLKRTDETRERNRLAKSGKADSEETRTKKSEAAKARHAAVRRAHMCASESYDQSLPDAVEEAIKRIDAALKHFEQE